MEEGFDLGCHLSQFWQALAIHKMQAFVDYILSSHSVWILKSIDDTGPLL